MGVYDMQDTISGRLVNFFYFFSQNRHVTIMRERVGKENTFLRVLWPSSVRYPKLLLHTLW